jgi:hypothetical protein
MAVHMGPANMLWEETFGGFFCAILATGGVTLLSLIVNFFFCE